MTTNTAGTSARQDPRQVLNTIKRTLNYNDSDKATAAIGTLPNGNPIPQSAFIIDCLVEVVTAFNAGTTNTLSIGTNSASFNNIVIVTDVDLTTAGVTRISRGAGRSLTNTADTGAYAILTVSGVAATAGQAVITITYDGGFSS